MSFVPIICVSGVECRLVVLLYPLSLCRINDGGWQCIDIRGIAFHGMKIRIHVRDVIPLTRSG